MERQTTSPRSALSPETARGIWMWLFKAACLPPFIAAMLFLPTGRTWPMGWAHVGQRLVAARAAVGADRGAGGDAGAVYRADDVGHAHQPVLLADRADSIGAGTHGH